MKSSTKIYALLLIFLFRPSCKLLDLDFMSPFFSPANWGSIRAVTDSQDCETLSMHLTTNIPLVYVTVDDEEFSCTWDESRTAQFCDGPSSSLDPNLTIKIYEGKGNTEPKKIITIPNQRPWDSCDFDDDGALDAEDSCPSDPDIKICACDVGDGDLDGDNVPDCIDNCPEDPEKTEPGRCGCAVSDLDTDSDGMPDCLDECPADPAKEAPEQCGCGVDETDTDGDWVADCVDQCPEDYGKSEPGICGCGLSDLDEDEDGLVLCNDICPGDAWHDEVGDPCNHDEDSDGTLDGVDGCPFDPAKTSRGLCGCGKTEASCQ